MGFLSIIPAWAWRWIAILSVGAALYGTGWIKGKIHEEKLFDEYKSQVKAVGDRQNYLTQETIKVHKALKETSDAKAKTAAAERDAALERVRTLQSTSASRSFLPRTSPSTASSNRVCFAADQLDRGVRQAIDRLQQRVVAGAAEGQRGVDTAVVCRDWAKSRGE